MTIGEGRVMSQWMTLKYMVPIFGKFTYIINVDARIFDARQYALHNCLSNVEKAFESHQESCILVLGKQRNDGAEILTFFVKLKGIVLHTDVKFSAYVKYLIWSVKDIVCIS